SDRFGLWIGSPEGLYHGSVMAFPIRVCVVCSEEFELKPDKPGFANRYLSMSFHWSYRRSFRPFDRS
ncbi:MAG TPA: hypothetical protein VII23_12965, partial [Terriglobales bacterium]